ncbi:unnamed protein product [Fraxinus pennsylvanica]|uniref:Pectinesterase inhibitor domain-containing protein n=1 Tax=Fraxinus pennsylvanica TaxID=56036 RepID=A0AAD1ZU00_9LAMI|nr:unnamed protein product [Fraxinus pennsylvanica]
MVSKSFILVSLALVLLCGCLADLVDDICSANIIPSLCNQVLRSDPRSQRAKTPRDLGPIALNMALEGTKATLKAVQSVGKGPIVDTCIEVIEDAIDNLNGCRPLLDATDRSKISDLQTHTSTALSDVSTCDDSYDEGGVNEPPQISQASKRAQVIIDILINIANRL